MDNLLKRLIFASIALIIIYAASSFIINHRKEKKIKNNEEVNSSIEKKIYQNQNEFKNLIKSLNQSYKSTDIIKLLHANHLIEKKKYNESIEVLDNVLNSKSLIIKELIFMLKARALAGKGLCDDGLRFYNQISYHQSIKDISAEEIRNCLSTSGGSK